MQNLTAIICFILSTKPLLLNCNYLCYIVTDTFNALTANDKSFLYCSSMNWFWIKKKSTIMKGLKETDQHKAEENHVIFFFSQGSELIHSKRKLGNVLNFKWTNMQVFISVFSFSFWFLTYFWKKIIMYGFWKNAIYSTLKYGNNMH